MREFWLIFLKKCLQIKKKDVTLHREKEFHLGFDVLIW